MTVQASGRLLSPPLPGRKGATLRTDSPRSSACCPVLAMGQNAANPRLELHRAVLVLASSGHVLTTGPKKGGDPPNPLDLRVQGVPKGHGTFSFLWC